jgi:hypothetical protein
MDTMGFLATLVLFFAAGFYFLTRKVFVLSFVSLCVHGRGNQLLTSGLWCNVRCSRATTTRRYKSSCCFQAFS